MPAAPRSRFRPALLAAVAFAASSAWACPPPGWDRSTLQALRAEGFAIEDAVRRDALALALVDCLASPDPVLRDEVAYEALMTWLRADQLSPSLRERLLADLGTRLLSPAPDPHGVRSPFDALALAEVARTDRVAPWMSAEQRVALVETAATYLESIDDYRGFDATVGWRHGVAHGADLAMQLTLNPALDKPSLDRLLAAIASQVAPEAAPAYTRGEPERLARPVVFLLQRDLHAEAEWSAWLQGMTPTSADEGLSRAVALDRRHNRRAFMLALYASLRSSGNAALEARSAAVLEALRRVP